MQEDDLTLLRHYADDGNQAAFAEVVRRNMNFVYSSAFRRVGGDAHLAKDVAQDVFISLSRHTGQLSRYQCLTGWFYTATRNAAVNRVRGEIRRRLREQEAQTMNDFLPDSGRDADWNQVAPILEKALDEIGGRDRLAILLRFLERRTFSEIGTVLQINEDAARMRVDRALGKLRSMLARRGIRSSAAALAAVMTQHAVLAAPPELAAMAASTALATPTTIGMRVVDFITSFRMIELAVIVGSLVTIGGAFFLAQSTHRANANFELMRSAEQREVALGQQRLRDFELREQALKQTRANLETAVDTARLQASKRNSAFAGSEIDRNSKTGARLAGGRRTDLAATYDAFYQSLDLTSEQIAAFETIHLQGMSPAIWVFDHPATSTADVPARLSPAQVDQQLQALLGESVFAKYRDYNRVVPARQVAMQLASSVYLTDPISPEQGLQLTKLLAESSPSYQSGGDIDFADIDWNRVLASTQKMFSPAQTAALSAVQQQITFQNALLQHASSVRASSP